jgi:hypothetical protein
MQVQPSNCQILWIALVCSPARLNGPCGAAYRPKPSHHASRVKAEKVGSVSLLP